MSIGETPAAIAADESLALEPSSGCFIGDVAAIEKRARREADTVDDDDCNVGDGDT